MPVQTIIKLRRDTAANWVSANPVLAAGETGLETDSGLVKYGNGTSAWADLPYATASSVKTRVRNATGASIPKGSVVYISGANGDNPLISLADADTELTSSKTLGFTETAIANGADGYVIESGLISGLNTAGATAGQSVWLSSTAGGFVFGNPPAKPANSVYLGIVTRANTNNGTILVKVQNGYELNELHDVNADNPATGDVLQWNGTEWVNGSIDISTKQDKVAGVSDTEIGYLDGVTSAIQTQLNGKAASTHTHAISDVTNLQTSLDAKANLAGPTFTGTTTIATGSVTGNLTVGGDLRDTGWTASRALATDASGNAVTTAVTATELGQLSGVTSAIQTQINGKANTSHTHSIADVTNLQTSLNNKLDGSYSTSNYWLRAGAEANPNPRDWNVAIGFRSLNAAGNSTTDVSTAVGSYAGERATFGGTYFGNAAGARSGSQRNLAIGIGAIGDAFTAVGTAEELVAVGRNSLSRITTGNRCTAVGNESLANASTGGFNTAFGFGTLRFVTTGTNNVSIGNTNFSPTTGSNNIIIGSFAEPASATVSNSITLGDSQITSLRCNVTSISGLSDVRDKTEIESIPIGLEFVEKLNPVRFTWNQRDGGRVGLQDSGFIAQELIELEDEYGAHEFVKLTMREDEDRYEASPARLIPVLVKAIQELSLEVKLLKEQING